MSNKLILPNKLIISNKLILPTHEHSGLSQPLVVLPPENRKGRRPYWYKELMAWVTCLKKDFPTSEYVQIKTIPYKLGEPEGSYRCGSEYYHGDCQYNDELDYYTITLCRIEQRAFVPFMVQQLWHEWTHLLLGLNTRKNHPQRFWKLYGKIYEFYIDNVKEKSIGKS